MAPIGFGCEPGDFADDIGPGRKRLQIRCPRPGSFTTHVRFAKMIQHECDLRNAAREFGHIAQLLVPDTQVEGESKTGKQLDAANKFRSEAIRQIRFALQIPANAFHKRTACQLFQIRADSFTLFQRRMRNDAVEPRLGFCQAGHPIYLGQALRRLTTGFHKDDFVHVHCFARRRKIWRQKRAVQSRQFVQPSVMKPCWIPKVNVRISNG